MSARPPRLGWLPPLLVGASAAVAAEVAVAVLLYEGPGFIRSLTVILGIEALALAGGAWSAPAPGPDLVDRLRNRWLLCLLAFLAAALFAGAWSMPIGLGADRLSQGLGLAILAGLPLYAASSVLGGIAVAARTDHGGRLRPPGGAAFIGVGLGVIVTGLLLPKAPMPASLLIGCLVMLSLGGMIYGGVLGARTEIDVRARRASRNGEVRVEDRRVEVDDVAVRTLLEGGHTRRAISLTGGDLEPWDVSVVRSLMPGMESPWRVLLLGGGASTAARSVLREHPLATVDVVERTGAVVELGRDHFSTELTIARGERLSVEVGNLDELVEDLTAEYDLVVVDTGALAPVGGVLGLSRSTRARLAGTIATGGSIVWGPSPPEPGRPEQIAGWKYVTHRRGSENGRGEHVILAHRAVGDEPVPSLDGFEATSDVLGTTSGGSDATS